MAEETFFSFLDKWLDTWPNLMHLIDPMNEAN
jgi:hypothetical protein